MTTRNEAVERILAEYDPGCPMEDVYSFDPITGNVSSNVWKYRYCINETWYPVFDKNDVYIGYYSGYGHYVTVEDERIAQAWDDE